MLHKLIKYVGAKHHRARYRYAHSFKVVAHRVVLYDVVDKCQAAPFASKRTLTYSGEIGIIVEAIAVKYCHHAAVLHTPILHDEVEEELAHCRCFVDVAEPVCLDYLGDWKHGARIEPSRDVVVGCVIQ